MSQVPEQTIFISDLISPPTSESGKAQNVQNESSTSHSDDSQLDPVVTFDDQDDLMVSFDNQIDSVVILEDLNNDHVVTPVEQTELLPHPDFARLIHDQQTIVEECRAINEDLKSKNALLTKDFESLQMQLNFFKAQEKREKSFEVSFTKAHQNEKYLERQMRDLAASKNALLSEIEQLKHEHKKQINALTLENKKAKAELLNC